MRSVAVVGGLYTEWISEICCCSGWFVHSGSVRSVAVVGGLLMEWISEICCCSGWFVDGVDQ